MRTRRIKVRHKNRKPRGDSKTIPLWGSDERGGGEDHGKWFECWNCGWPCNTDRDPLGGPETKASVSYEVFNEVDQYGTASTATNYREIGGSGCPFCHASNYRGDY